MRQTGLACDDFAMGGAEQRWSISERESGLILSPTFSALQALRKAYQTDAKHDPSVCAGPLRQVRGYLNSVDGVRDLVGRLSTVDGSRPIPPKVHKQLVAIESQIVRHVGGEISPKTLERALRGITQIEKSEWCRSADDLAEHLTATHQQICASFKPPRRGLKYFVQRSRNAKLMLHGDQAVLAVVIVLGDLLKRPYLRQSYRIGAYLADEANTAISNGNSENSAQRSANSNEGSAQ